MTIAFIDHHLENWHAKVFLGLLRERGHDVIAWESHPLSALDWCAEHGVPRAETLAAAVEAADAIFVLAPDDIEHHRALSDLPLRSGKPVWVDKLLATQIADAEAMLELAATHVTPVSTGSSLYHAVELEAALGPAFEEGQFAGYGAWDRYGVHTLAMAQRVFGGGVTQIVRYGSPQMPTVILEWADGRRATLTLAHGTDGGKHSPWRFILRAGETLASGTITDFEGFYRNQLEAVLTALTQRSSMPADEMLDTVRILAS